MAKARLDKDLREAVEAGTPVQLVDSATGLAYYLISAEQYNKVRAALGGEFDPRDAYPMVDKIMAQDDASDPLLDTYQ